MDERTVIITEHNGTYQLQNNGIPEFALIGILECLLFDLKSASRQSSATRQQASPSKQIESGNHQSEKPRGSTLAPEEIEQIEQVEEIEGPPPAAVTDITENLKVASPEPTKEAPQPLTTPDLRTRIGNAVKAVRGLGAQIEDMDLTKLTEEELQSELEELTDQYKRLKSSKGIGK